MREVILLIAAIVVWYIYRWEQNSHPTTVLIGLGGTTALNALYFGAYIFFVEHHATHTAILMLAVLLGPAFDLLRKTYPDQGVFAGMMAMFTFVLSDNVPTSFTAFGLVLAVLPASVASIESYHTTLRHYRAPRMMDM